MTSSVQRQQLLSFNLKNLFPHLIIHPKNTIKGEKWKSWLASIVLGIFTAGFVHLGCWIYELSLKNKKLTIKKADNQTNTDKTTHVAAQTVFQTDKTNKPAAIPATQLSPQSQTNGESSQISVSTISAIDVTPLEKKETSLKGSIRIVGKNEPLSNSAAPGIEISEKEKKEVFIYQGWEVFYKEVDAGFITPEYATFFSQLSLENDTPIPTLTSEEGLIRCTLSKHSIQSEQFLTEKEIVLPKSFLSSQPKDLPIQLKYKGHAITVWPGDSLTLEDGSPLPLAANDSFIHLQIFNPTEELVKTKINPLCLLLPKSLLSTKKNDELIRLQYNGKLIELKINQVPTKNLHQQFCDLDEGTTGIWESDEDAVGTTEVFQKSLDAAVEYSLDKAYIPFKRYHLQVNSGEADTVLSQTKSTNFNLNCLSLNSFKPISGQIWNAKNGNFVCEINVPGMAQTDAEIYYKNRTLVIIIEPTAEEKESWKIEKKYFSATFFTDKFSNQDIENALANTRAKLQHGVLTLTIPL